MERRRQDEFLACPATAAQRRAVDGCGGIGDGGSSELCGNANWNASGGSSGWRGGRERFPELVRPPEAAVGLRMRTNQQHYTFTRVEHDQRCDGVRRGEFEDWKDHEDRGRGEGRQESGGRNLPGVSQSIALRKGNGSD